VEGAATAKEESSEEATVEAETSEVEIAAAEISAIAEAETLEIAEVETSEETGAETENTETIAATEGTATIAVSEGSDEEEVVIAKAETTVAAKNATMAKEEITTIEIIIEIRTVEDGIGSSCIRSSSFRKSPRFFLHSHLQLFILINHFFSTLSSNGQSCGCDRSVSSWNREKNWLRKFRQKKKAKISSPIQFAFCLDNIF
jgi:hypothetical protein